MKDYLKNVAIIGDYRPIALAMMNHNAKEMILERELAKEKAIEFKLRPKMIDLELRNEPVYDSPAPIIGGKKKTSKERKS